MELSDMTIEQLCHFRQIHKAEEERIAASRREYDAEIAKRLAETDEGTVSRTDGEYRVSVTYKLDRKLDADAIKAKWNLLSGIEQNCVKWAPSLDLKNYRALPNKATFADCLTTKPASPTIKIERIGDGN